jgi:lysophospholipase L1-like esterase
MDPLSLLLRLAGALGLLSLLLVCARHIYRARRLPSGPIDVLIVGSSVAAGTGAGCCGGESGGWAALLIETVETTRGLRCFNGAVPGFTAGRTRPRLQALLAASKPRVVLIGLSLGNERLAARRDTSSSQVLADEFVVALLAMASEAQAAGVGTVVFTGVYPHGWYQSHHLGALRSVDVALRQRGYAVVEMLQHLQAETTSGTWRPELKADFAHPNAAGHRVMYEQFLPRLDELFGPALSAGSGSSSGGAAVSPGTAPATVRRRVAEGDGAASGGTLRASLLAGAAE